jgi:WD40 repeat protein
MEMNKTIIYINLNEKIEEKEKPKIKYSNALMLNENYYCFSKQNEILVFNKKENKNVISIKDSNDDEDDFINYLSKTNNERIVSCCFNYKIKIIKLNFINYSFFIEQRLEGHNLLISKIIELNDGRLCSCSFDGTIKLWRMNENRMYEKEKNLFFREKKIFFSILEMNKIFVSLLKDTNENNWIYIIYEDKINDPIMISNNNLNIKKDNLIKFNDDEFLVGGNKKIFLYNIKGENVKEIKISINVCVGLRLRNNSFLFGGNKGEIVGLENLDDNKFFIEETTSHNKEIISLSENENCDIISRGLDRIKLFSLKLK